MYNVKKTKIYYLSHNKVSISVLNLKLSTNLCLFDIQSDTTSKKFMRKFLKVCTFEAYSNRIKTKNKPLNFLNQHFFLDDQASFTTVFTLFPVSLFTFSHDSSLIVQNGTDNWENLSTQMRQIQCCNFSLQNGLIGLGHLKLENMLLDRCCCLTTIRMKSNKNC